ncbi:M50 family metallopeptidase [Mycoplasmatota bacterium]|nr:M50 family metallopeptidase [Mycoplasmatota bacterium]
MEKKSKVKNGKIFKRLKLLFYMIIVLFYALLIIGGGTNAIKLILLIFLQIIVICILIINIHEFGHLIIGKLFGYKLLSYRIGFFSWSKENGKMKFLIIKNRGYSGLCGMIPPEKELPNYKLVLFYASGILFNVISGTFFLILSLINGSLSQFFSFLGISSILIGVLNLLPIMTSNNPSDGKVIWSMLLKKPFAEKLLVMKRLLTKLSAGIRPNHLDIPNLNLDNLTSFDLYIIIYAYFQALDKNYDDKIFLYANLLEENIDNFPTPTLPVVYYELCYVGCITNDIDRAKKYYKHGGNILKKDKDINGCRVKAYYEFYVNHNPDTALELCYKGLAVLDKFPIKGQAFMEKDLIHSLIRLINL